MNGGVDTKNVMRVAYVPTSSWRRRQLQLRAKAYHARGKIAAADRPAAPAWLGFLPVRCV